MPDEERRRSTVDASGAQMGDVTSRDAAGRDIVHYGPDLDALLRFVEGTRNSTDALAAAVVRVHERLAEMDRAQRRAEMDAAHERGIDFEARLKRQAQLDADIAALRRWLVSLTLAVIAIGLILAGVVWYELGLFACAAYDVLAHGGRQ